MRTVLPLPAGERCLEGLQPTVGQSWWGAPFIPLWLPSWSSGRLTSGALAPQPYGRTSVGAQALYNDHLSEQAQDTGRSGRGLFTLRPGHPRVPW